MTGAASPRYHSAAVSNGAPTAPRPKDPNVFHPATVCVAPITYADLGLVEEFRMVAGQTKKDVKVTMTGPNVLAKVAYDEHYGHLARIGPAVRSQRGYSS